MKKDKRKSKSASKPTRPLNQIRGVIGNRKQWAPLRAALDTAKGEASPLEYRHLYGLAQVSPMLSTAYAASKPLTKPGQVQAVEPLEAVSFYRELAWACTVIRHASSHLRNYVPLRDSYLAAVARGDFGRAILDLNRIDRLCGASLWSVENRVALLTLQGGFENQKSFVRAVTSSYPKTFLSFFIANISERNEARVSIRGFESRLRERAKAWDIKADKLAYIFYKLLGAADATLLAAGNLLAQEGSSSTIDLYETLIDILCRLRDNSGIRRELVAAQLRPLLILDDHSLRNLLTAYTDGAAVAASVIRQEYLELFLVGKYALAADATKRALQEDPEDVAAVTIAAKLHALGVAVDMPGVGFSHVSVRLLSSYFEHSEGADARAEDIEKLAINFRHLPSAASVPLATRGAASMQLVPLALATAVRLRNTTVHAALLLSPAATFEDVVGNRSVTEVFYTSSRNAELLSAPGELSAEAVCHAELQQLLSAAQFDDALKPIARLGTSEFPYFRRQARVYKAWALYRDGNVLDALLESVDTTIGTPALGRSMPLEEIVRRRGFRELKRLQDRLALPIAFQWYMQATGDRSKEVALKVAWKQLLQHYLINKPSELGEQTGMFDRAELASFLRSVCVQEVMELGKAFSSPTDLDEERLQVCVMLSSIDPDRASQYSAEIIELTRRLSIEEGVKQVESSRVYVDIFGLEHWAVSTLQEPFLRYLDYVSAGLQASVMELEKRLVEILKRGGKIQEVASFLDDYDVSADSILEDLIEQAANAFMTLPRYGLDAFLGSRVRHGSLEGAFRSPLEHRRLVTKIESSSGDYESNAFWYELSLSAEVVLRKRVDDALRKFSRGVDAVIDNAVSRYVYVRTESNQDGLIALWSSDAQRRQMLQRWVIDVKIHLTPSATVAEFLNYCVGSFFWPALSHSLEGIRRFIRGQLAGELVGLLQGLKKEISTFVPADRLGGFNNYVKVACLDIDAAAEKISKWFATPQKPQHQLSFPLKTAIEIGLQSTRRIRPHFNPLVTWDVEPEANVVLRTAAFETVNDIAFLIFGNISKHGGFPERGLSGDTRPGVDISIVLRQPNFIDIRVESDIGEDADEAQIRRNVAAAKATIAERRYDEVARKRRGTGLVRLASTLNYEGAEDKVIDFGVTESLRFFVYVSAPQFYFSMEEQNAKTYSPD